MKSSTKLKIWCIAGTICSIPFIITAYYIITNYFHGATFISDTRYYGFEAVEVTVVGMLIFFWWLYLICLAGIVAAIVRISILGKMSKDNTAPDNHIQTIDDIVNSDWEEH